MCGRAYDPRFLFTWPNSRISVMGGPQAAGVLSTVKNDQIEKETGVPMNSEEIAEFEKPLLEKYEREGSPYFATARLWDDGVIQVEDTRKTIGQALRIVSKDFSEPNERGSIYGVLHVIKLVRFFPSLITQISHFRVTLKRLCVRNEGQKHD